MPHAKKGLTPSRRRNSPYGLSMCGRRKRTEQHAAWGRTKNHAFFQEGFDPCFPVPPSPPSCIVAGSRNSGAVLKRPFFAAKRGAPWLPSVVGEEKNQNLIPSFARCNQDMEQNGEKDNAAAAAAAAVGTSWRIPSPSLYLFTLWQK